MPNDLICYAPGCQSVACWKGLCTKHYQRLRAYGILDGGKFERTSSLRDHIDQRVSPTTETGCLLWTGPTNKRGYGVVSFRYKREFAHRAAWRIEKGEIPQGAQINHTCDNPSCVNTSHLYAGTQKQNIDDMIQRDRINRKGEGCNGPRKLSEEDVLGIRESNFGRDVLAKKFGVSKQTITDVKTRRSWSHI